MPLRWHADEVEISPFKSRVRVLKCADCGAVASSVSVPDKARKKIGETLPPTRSFCPARKRKRNAQTAARRAQAAKSG